MDSLTSDQPPGPDQSLDQHPPDGSENSFYFVPGYLGNPSQVRKCGFVTIPLGKEHILCLFMRAMLLWVTHLLYNSPLKKLATVLVDAKENMVPPGQESTRKREGKG